MPVLEIDLYSHWMWWPVSEHLLERGLNECTGESDVIHAVCTLEGCLDYIWLPLLCIWCFAGILLGLPFLFPVENRLEEGYKHVSVLKGKK